MIRPIDVVRINFIVGTEGQKRPMIGMNSGTLLFLLLVFILSMGCGSGSTQDRIENESEVAIDSAEHSTSGSSDGGSSVEPSGSDVDDNADDSDALSASAHTISVDLVSHANPRVVYVIWVENESRTFVQNLYICARVLDGSLTGDALPYWALHKKNHSTVDGLSGATIAPEFTITRDLSNMVGNRFTIYAEVDHSFDDNDWFNNQPALLYAANVDLSNIQSTYTLSPIGWTKMAENRYTNTAGGPTSADGELNTEMRYITNHASDGGFGGEDNRTATSIVDTIVARLN